MFFKTEQSAFARRQKS